MPPGQIHEQISDEYLQQFDRPLPIAAMKKLRQFPMIQELGFNGALGFQKETFHGLKDFNKQLERYSRTKLLLWLAWKVISAVAPKNPAVELLLFKSSIMGKVGKLFKSIHNFDRVFAVNTDEVLDPDKIQKKIASVV